jgi:uncharacterized protein YjbI with pentapeptide repeats
MRSWWEIAVAAGVIAWRNVRATQARRELNGEAQVANPLTQAIGQLGADANDGQPDLQVRLGGIYALERIARDFPRDHWTIMEVLTAYVRQNASRKAEEEAEPTHANRQGPGADIQAILSVLGRRTPPREGAELKRLDLAGTDLGRASLAGANLRRVSLGRANLSRADLAGADLREAVAERANLSRASLGRASLGQANLGWAELAGADLSEADLSEAFLAGTNFSRAELAGANLSDAFLVGANLRRANLKHANLSGASLGFADLTGADLSEADLRGTNLAGAKLRDVRTATEDQVTSAWPAGPASDVQPT